MTAPTLVSSVPSNGATDIDRNSSLYVIFSENIDAASVLPSTVYLKNTELDQIVEVELAVDSINPKKVVVVPAQLMIPSSSYLLVLVGADVSTTNLQSSGDALVTTVQIAFQTGTGISGPTVDTGDLTLPEEISVSASASAALRVLSATPRHHKFAIPTTTREIRVRFNRSIDPTTVTGNVQMSQYAYYEEDRLLAVETDLGAGAGLRHYFAGETGNYTEADSGILDPDLFASVDGAVSVDDTDIVWTFSGELQKNLCLEMLIGASVKDTDGNELGSDQIWFGCTEPWPNWVSVSAVRHEVGHEASAHIPEDFIGLRVWQASIDLAGELNWMIDFATPGRYYKAFVRCSAALDLWSDLKVTAALAAGTTKKLGDLTIVYAATAAAVRPWKITRLEEDCKKKREQIYGVWTGTPRTGVRSLYDALEPSREFFRQRLWRSELVYNDVLTPANVANTAAERLQEVGMTSAKRYWLAPLGYLQ